MVELGEYGLKYQPRTEIKSQVLADFIADFTFKLHLKAERELFAIINSNNTVELWTLSIDGSSDSRGIGGDSTHFPIKRCGRKSCTL